MAGRALPHRGAAPSGNFNPHVHVLAADGAFRPDGTFVLLPTVPEGLLEEGFGRAVLEFLARNGARSEALRSKLLGWRSSGFSVHNPVRVGEGNAEGRSKLAGTMLRAPMSLEEDELRRRDRDGHRPLQDAPGVEAQLPGDARRPGAG